MAVKPTAKERLYFWFLTGLSEYLQSSELHPLGRLGPLPRAFLPPCLATLYRTKPIETIVTVLRVSSQTLLSRRRHAR